MYLHRIALFCSVLALTQAQGGDSHPKEDERPIIDYGGIKPGTCPVEEGGFSICGGTPCRGDEDCQGTQKCCQRSCGKLCMQPPDIAPIEVEPLAPLPPVEGGGGLAVGEVHHPGVCPTEVGDTPNCGGNVCSGDGDCPGYMKCCQATECGESPVCMPAPQISPPRPRPDVPVHGGVCPSDVGDSPMCSESSFECSNDGDCSPMDKCCECPGRPRVCMPAPQIQPPILPPVIGTKPIHPGVCPKRGNNELGNCEGRECVDDTYCEMEEKCCGSACGYHCTPVVLREIAVDPPHFGQCPAGSTQGVCDNQPCARDSDCASLEKCCGIDSCGFRCVPSQGPNPEVGPETTCTGDLEYNSCGVNVGCVRTCEEPEERPCSRECNPGCFCPTGMIRRSWASNICYDDVAECDSETPCEEERRVKMAANTETMGTFIPQCTPDGLYAPVQCRDNSLCWCADIHTGAVVPDSEVPVGEGEPVCMIPPPPPIDPSIFNQCPEGKVFAVGVKKCVFPNPPEPEPECPGIQVYSDCMTACPAYCGQSETVACIAMCVPGCGCPEGTILAARDSTECIHQDMCSPVPNPPEPQPECPGIQVYSDCMTACPAYCGQSETLPCIAMCVGGCGCPEGTVLAARDSTECIHQDMCSPVPNPPEPELECPGIQVYSECMTACPAYCGQSESLACIAMCVPGCGCPEGTVLAAMDSTECIHEDMCSPVKAVTEESCTGDLTFNDCGVNSGCVQTCSDPEERPCTKECNRGCYCPPGMIRDSLEGNTCYPSAEACAIEAINQCPEGMVFADGVKKCVLPVMECPGIQVYSECMTACPAYCGQSETVACIDMCVAGCGCPEGTILAARDSTECIHEDMCSSVTEESCTGDLIFNDCGVNSGCVRTCSDPEERPCTKECNRGCYCPPGMIRDSLEGNTCYPSAEACAIEVLPMVCGRGYMANDQGACVVAKPCPVAYDEAAEGGFLPGEFVPTCTEDGTYEEIQCWGSTGHCWCVHVETGVKREETVVRGTPDCSVVLPPIAIADTVVSCVEGYMMNDQGTCIVAKPCFVALAEAREGGVILGAFVPTCTEDGTYEEIQCWGSTGQCWCVHVVTGVKREETVVRGTPDCSVPTETCPEGMSYSECGSSCPEYCNQPGDVVCTLQCVSGCFCDPGTILSDRDAEVCVPAEECAPPPCPGDKEFQSCGTACPSYCNEPEFRPCTLQCVSGCFCPPGTTLLDVESDMCVPIVDCPVPLATPVCEGDLVHTDCGTACPLVCGQPPPDFCTFQCIIGCQCPQGMYQDANDPTKCMALEECSTGPVCPPKKGTCPSMDEDKVTCTEECSDDYDCSGERKCCPHSCGSACYYPRFYVPQPNPSDFAPVPTSLPAEGMSVDTCPGADGEAASCDDICTQDSDCAAGSMCCMNTVCAGHVCMPALVEQMCTTVPCPVFEDNSPGDLLNKYCGSDYSFIVKVRSDGRAKILADLRYDPNEDPYITDRPIVKIAMDDQCTMTLKPNGRYILMVNYPQADLGARQITLDHNALVLPLTGHRKDEIIEMKLSCPIA